MPNVLITAFDAYDCWKENSSWLALVELTRNLPAQPQITTRRYPVDFAAVREKLTADLAANYDFALHLGQAPGSARVRLEAIGINVGGTSAEMPDQFQPLVADGPVAFRSQLPLANWAAKLREAGIPAQVSYHAGTYLCNATLYLSHLVSQQQGWNTRAAFIHLPLAPSQVLNGREDTASLPTTMAAQALRLIIEELRDVALA